MCAPFCACVFESMSACKRVYLSVRELFVDVHIFACLYMNICVYAYVYVYACVCVRVWLSVYTRARVCFL